MGIHAPSDLGWELVSRLRKGKTSKYDYDKGVFIIPCEEKDDYVDIRFSISDLWFTVEASQYIKEVDEECYIAIQPDLNGDWSFGAFILEG